MLGSVLLVSAGGALATDPQYVNDGIVDSTSEPPPVVDAVSFINNGSFSVDWFSFNTKPYTTYNTLNYTNRGYMHALWGFDFQTFPSPLGAEHMASSFYNIGTIDVNQRLLISATNVHLRSTCTAPSSGLMQISGRKVDASRGALLMGSGTSPAGPGTQQIVYWGVGTNSFNPGPLETSAVTPLHEVTNTAGLSFETLLSLPLADSYVDQVSGDSNETYRVAFVQDLSPNVTNHVYFTQGAVVVEWVYTLENPFTGSVVTNYLYLRDDFGSTTNLLTVPTNSTPRRPVNYTLFNRTTPDSSLPSAAAVTSPPGVFTPGTVPNDYAAWAVDLTAASATIPPLGGINLMPGRVEISAEETLNLELARIATPNLLSLESPNHFEGSAGSKILAVYTDLNLGSTNGMLSVSNLLLPSIPKLVGSIEMYSSRWTTVTDGVTNNYSTLFVDSRFNSGTPALVQNLHLRGDSVVISDELNVLSNALIEAESLTITENGPGSPAPNGGALNFLRSDVLWSSALPSLQRLTNHGMLSAQNAVYFGSPGSPYQSFVNTGSIMNEGTLIWSDHIENRGTNDTGIGSFTATFGDAVLSDPGRLQVFQGDIRLTGDSLQISNHFLYAGRELALDIADYLDDGGPANDNQWFAGPYGGVLLLRKPAAGDLLGTTITIPLDNYEEAPIVWAGQDMGRTTNGFVNNAGLKGLVLDGGDYSLFTFAGTSSSNALYVETLTLLDYTTDVDSGIEIAPNMRVYYAQAFAGGTDVSEALDGALSDRLRWVPDYAGAFSSVQIAYSPTEKVVMNAALAASMTIDSDADGLVNGEDPTPLYTGSQVNLKIGLTDGPPRKPLLTWATLPGAQNVVLYKDSGSVASWLVLTNFVSTGNTASIVDAGSGDVARMYRVQVTAP